MKRKPIKLKVVLVLLRTNDQVRSLVCSASQRLGPQKGQEHQRVHYGRNTLKHCRSSVLRNRQIKGSKVAQRGRQGRGRRP